jgi:hypothetical protein
LHESRFNDPNQRSSQRLGPRTVTHEDSHTKSSIALSGAGRPEPFSPGFPAVSSAPRDARKSRLTLIFRMSNCSDIQ